MVDTFTTRLGLRRPDRAEQVNVVEDIIEAMDKIDVAVDRVCTSTTRPTTGLYIGMRCYETDTKRYIVLQTTDPVQWVYLGTLGGNASARPTAAESRVGLLYYDIDRKTLVGFDGTNYKEISMPVISAVNQIANPYAGMLAFNGANNFIYRYDGSNWKVALALGGGIPTLAAHGRWVHRAQASIGATGDHAMGFEVARTPNTNVVTPSTLASPAAPNTNVGSGFNRFVTNYDGVYDIKYSARSVNSGNFELMMYTGDVYSGGNVIAVGSAARFNASCAAEVYLPGGTPVRFNLYNPTASGAISDFGDATHVSITYRGLS